MDSLDILATILAYLSIENYGANIEQNKKLDAITFDIEQKLNRQEALLLELLERSKNGENVQDIYGQDNSNRRQ